MTDKNSESEKDAQTDNDGDSKGDEPSKEIESKEPDSNKSKEHKRSSLSESVFKTLTYISDISDDKSITYRVSDKHTTNFLGVALLCSVVFAALPSLQLESLAFVCYVIADIFLILAVTGFVLTRFGVIRAMEPRYALVCWHLMVGTGLLFLTLGFNFVVIIVLALKYDAVRNFFGG